MNAYILQVKTAHPDAITTVHTILAEDDRDQIDALIYEVCLAIEEWALVDHILGRIVQSWSKKEYDA